MKDYIEEIRSIITPHQNNNINMVNALFRHAATIKDGEIDRAAAFLYVLHSVITGKPDEANLTYFKIALSEKAPPNIASFLKKGTKKVFKVNPNKIEETNQFLSEFGILAAADAGASAADAGASAAPAAVPQGGVANTSQQIESDSILAAALAQISLEGGGTTTKERIFRMPDGSRRHTKVITNINGDILEQSSFITNQPDQPGRG
jgi:hypothetical protein